MTRLKRYNTRRSYSKYGRKRSYRRSYSKYRKGGYGGRYKRSRYGGGRGTYVPRGSISVTTARANTVRSKGAINCITITNSEYVGDIVMGVPAGGAEFWNPLIALNPGSEGSAAMFINPENPNLFPWLSGLAKLYDTHAWQYLEFELRTTSGEYQGGTAGVGLGTITMVVNYDATTPAFTTKRALLNYDGAVSAKPSQNMSIRVDNKRALVPLSHMYNTANVAGTPAGDKRMAYIGWLQVGMSGITGTPTTHQLWCKYSCKLCQPKVADGTAGPVIDTLFFNAQVNDLTGTTWSMGQYPPPDPLPDPPILCITNTINGELGDYGGIDAAKAGISNFVLQNSWAQYGAMADVETGGAWNFYNQYASVDEDGNVLSIVGTATLDLRIPAAVHNGQVFIIYNYVRYQRQNHMSTDVDDPVDANPVSQAAAAISGVTELNDTYDHNNIANIALPGAYPGFATVKTMRWRHLQITPSGDATDVCLRLTCTYQPSEGATWSFGGNRYFNWQVITTATPITGSVTPL